MWLAWGDFSPLKGYNNLSQQGTVVSQGVHHLNSTGLQL